MVTPCEGQLWLDVGMRFHRLEAFGLLSNKPLIIDEAAEALGTR